MKGKVTVVHCCLQVICELSTYGKGGQYPRILINPPLSNPSLPLDFAHGSDDKSRLKSSASS
jgi:hypothetical protein